MLEKEIAKIEFLQSKYVNFYSLTEQVFEVGDTAYIMYDNQPKEVIITEAEDYSTKETDGCIYYWFEHKDLTKLEKFWEYIKFKIYCLPFVHKLYTYHPGKKWMGHGVSAGLGEFLHKTKEQCELSYYFNEALWNLDILNYELKEKNYVTSERDL